MPKIRITQGRSLIGVPVKQKKTVKALGLKRIGHSVIHEDRPEILGMVHKVSHLVTVEKS